MIHLADSWIFFGLKLFEAIQSCIFFGVVIDILPK